MSGQNYIGTIQSAFRRIQIELAARRAIKTRVFLLRIMPSHKEW